MIDQFRSIANNRLQWKNNGTNFCRTDRVHQTVLVGIRKYVLICCNKARIWVSPNVSWWISLILFCNIFGYNCDYGCRESTHGDPNKAFAQKTGFLGQISIEYYTKAVINKIKCFQKRNLIWASACLWARAPITRNEIANVYTQAPQIYRIACR